MAGGQAYADYLAAQAAAQPKSPVKSEAQVAYEKAVSDYSTAVKNNTVTSEIYNNFVNASSLYNQQSVKQAADDAAQVTQSQALQREFIAQSKNPVYANSYTPSDMAIANTLQKGGYVPPSAATPNTMSFLNPTSASSGTSSSATFTPTMYYGANKQSHLATTQAEADMAIASGWSTTPVVAPVGSFVNADGTTPQPPVVTKPPVDVPPPVVTKPPVDVPPPVVTKPPVDVPPPVVDKPTGLSQTSIDDLVAKFNKSLTDNNKIQNESFNNQMKQFTSDNQTTMTKNNQSLLAGNMDAFKNFAIPTSQQNGVNLGNYNDNRNSSADQWWSQYVTGRR